MNTDPHFHHINIDDLNRIMADRNYTAVPLCCHEDDCFVEGSELHAQPSETQPGSSTTAPSHLSARQES